MGPDIILMKLRNFSKSWDFIPSFLRVMGLWRELSKPLIKPYIIAEKVDPYLAILVLRTTKSSSSTSASELLMKRKLQTLEPLLNININNKAKLEKSTVSESRELQTLIKSHTVRSCQNNNWIQTGIILKNTSIPYIVN